MKEATTNVANELAIKLTNELISVMNKRVYGVIGVSSILSNWNAGFDKYPKSLSDGTVYGSDKALKYTIKRMWEAEGEKTLYMKTGKFSLDKKTGNINLVPNSLQERYERLTDIGLDKKIDAKKVLIGLMNIIDVKNFGATFTVAGSNIAITGAVQFGQGPNKYEDTVAEEQQILSPFRDPSKEKEKDEEAKGSSLGSKIMSNEAHYFYPFVINPKAYDEYVEMGVTNGYTEEDYKKFKKAALTSVTSYATNAKEGCENEFALFVETAPDLYLPNLSEYITFKKEDEVNVIDMERCLEILKEVEDRITSVEIYYNPYTTRLVGDTSNAKTYNIVNLKEM